MDFLLGDHSRDLSGIWDSKGEAYKGLLETVQWVFLRKESERFHRISFLVYSMIACLGTRQTRPFLRAFSVPEFKSRYTALCPIFKSSQVSSTVKKSSLFSNIVFLLSTRSFWAVVGTAFALVAFLSRRALSPRTRGNQSIHTD